MELIWFCYCGKTEKECKCPEGFVKVRVTMPEKHYARLISGNFLLSKILTDLGHEGRFSIYAHRYADLMRAAGMDLPS
jgi:hypothetical protein